VVRLPDGENKLKIRLLISTGYTKVVAFVAEPGQEVVL